MNARVQSLINVEILGTLGIRKHRRRNSRICNAGRKRCRQHSLRNR